MCPSYLEVEKTGSQLFRARQTLLQLFGYRKKWIPAIRRPKAISSLINTVAAIWRQKKVDPCYQETKKWSSQLLGASKKIMTSI